MWIRLFLSDQASKALLVGLTVVWFREHGGGFNHFSGGSVTAAIRAILLGKLLLAAEKECKEFVVVFCTTWEVYRLFGVAATRK